MEKITLHDLPDDLCERLQRLAAANQRSLESQILAILEQVVSSTPLEIDVESFLSEARLMREESSLIIASDEELNQARRLGRA